ncbi:MAG: hypothetical protein AAF251_04295 [Pseudomonadota bacterium]
MSWARNKTIALRAAAVGSALSALIGGGVAFAEPAIIVKSTVKDYKVGTKIDDQDTITLADGDKVSVLTTKGSRTMKGPGTFVVGANPKSNRSRFTNLKRRGASTRTDPGAVRSAITADSGARLTRPKVFYVDVARSGRVCLSNVQDVSLWRPYDDKPATYLVNGPGLEQPVTVFFAERKSVAPPPEQTLALSGGATYTIVGGEAGEGPAMTMASVTIVDLRQDYARADQLADAFFENGCMAQFEVLSERLVSDE